MQGLIPKANAQVPGATITRENIIRNACTYLKHQWEPKPENLNANLWKVGAPPFNRQEDMCACPVDGASSCGWTKSTKVQEAIDEAARNNRRATYKGLPYSWGGIDRIDDFMRKISENHPAGDLCTDDDGGILEADGSKRLFTAGVDCSGFVWRTWGGSGDRFTTRTLPESQFTSPLAQAAMRPGDAVNKKKKHVRLVRGWRPVDPANPRPTDRLWTFESTDKVGCMGVCDKSYKLSQLNGYESWRSTRLKMPDPPLADPNLVNCRP